MPRDHRSPQLTRRKTYVFELISLALGTVLALTAAESLVRLKGIHPWVPPDLQIQVTPGGRFFTPHPTRGYAQLPGAFEVSLADEYTFHVTHLPSGLLIMHPRATYHDARPKPEIWIMGCSFTHGWSLNDQDTYPWVLQERLPDYEVVNYGVEAYGTLHALLQLRDALTTQSPPLVVIYAYASLHDERIPSCATAGSTLPHGTDWDPSFSPMRGSHGTDSCATPSRRSNTPNGR